MARTLAEDLTGTGLSGASAALIAEKIDEAASGGGVQSVNGETGVVVLTAADISGVVDTTTAQTVAGIKTFSSNPIIPVPADGPMAANKNYVDAQITVVTQNHVDLTTAQTVAGIKTFSASPIVPTPTTATQASTKGYVDGLDTANVKLTGAQTVAGIKTFSSSPIVPAPTTDTQASTKLYADTVAAPVVGVTAGTATASKALIVDAARGITGFRDTRATPLFKQAAPAATTNTATLTAAQMMTGLISGTPTAAAIYTLPLATAMETALIAAYPGLANDDAFEFNVINLGAAGFTITIATATGWTVAGGGSLVIQDSTTTTSSGSFRVRRTAANAYTLYRVA
jgi:hypothetical protein